MLREKLRVVVLMLLMYVKRSVLILELMVEVSLKVREWEEKVKYVILEFFCVVMEMLIGCRFMSGIMRGMYKRKREDDED